MAKLYDADTVMAEDLYNGMSTKKKIAYLWDYYKKILFFIIFLIGLAGMVYVLRPEAKPASNLRLKFVNARIEGLSDEDNSIKADYEAYLGEGNTCEMAFAYCKIDPNDETKGGVTLENLLFEVAAKRGIELFVFDEYAMNKLCPTGFVLDLNTCLDSEVLEQVQHRLVYHTDLEGNIVPMAIDITDTNYVGEMGIQGDGIYLSFAANSPNSEIVKQFVTYILTREN